MDAASQIITIGGGAGLGGVSNAPPVWLNGADVALGTKGSQYVGYVTGKGYVPVTSLLAVSRAQTVPSYAANADGTVTAFAANTLRFGVGAGLVIEPTRTNLMLQSADLSNAAYGSSLTGSGTLSVTGAAGAAPDGTTTASLVTINRSAVTDQAQRFQTFTGTVAAYNGGYYVKANSNADIGKSITIAFFDGTTAFKATVILIGGWQRVSNAATLTASASCNMGIGYSANDSSGTGSVSFLVWGAQAELGDGLTSYIPTTSAPVTRPADVITAIGDLLLAYQAAAVTQFSRVMNVVSSAAADRVGAAFNAAGGGTPAFKNNTAGTTINSYDGTTLGSAATVGNGVSFLNGPVNTVGSFSATGMSAVANGGAETTNALVMPAVISAWIGSDGGTASFLNGYLNRLLVWKSQLPSATRIALSQTFNTTSLTIGGQATRYLVPTEAASGTFVMYHHGAGEVETAWTADALKVSTREALLAQGHILSASNAAGDNWGNQAGLDAYSTQYTDAIARYSISKTIFFSQSMGGEAGLLNIAAGSIPVRGWYGIYPVCNLANMFAGNAGSFSGAIRTAYGIAPDGSDYAAKTAGHDPVLKSGSLFTIPMRFTSSAGDVTVNKAANAVQMQTLVAPFAAESFLLNTIGVHGDASNFIPSDVVAFIARC